MMSGRKFLDIARELVTGPTAFHWRAAAIHAYYALILECRDALLRWGLRIPRRDNMHAFVRLQFQYATSTELKPVGRVLDDLVQLRNHASYDMSPRREFRSPVPAQNAIQDSTAALALLDAIDADPVRRAAAIAALPP
jgi:hypothetical protein